MKVDIDGEREGENVQEEYLVTIQHRSKFFTATDISAEDLAHGKRAADSSTVLTRQ